MIMSVFYFVFTLHNWLDIHSMKVWCRDMLPNTNTVHFWDIFFTHRPVLLTCPKNNIVGYISSLYTGVGYRRAKKNDDDRQMVIPRTGPSGYKSRNLDIDWAQMVSKSFSVTLYFFFIFKIAFRPHSSI